MITLGKRGDLAARRLAGAYLMTDEAVVKLFDTVGPRFGDRNGGYTRVIRTGWNKGDGADKAFLELLGSEKVLDEKREKRAEARAKKVAEAKKAMEDAEAQAAARWRRRAGQGRSRRQERVSPMGPALRRGLLSCAAFFFSLAFRDTRPCFERARL